MGMGAGEIVPLFCALTWLGGLLTTPTVEGTVACLEASFSGDRNEIRIVMSQ